MLPALVAKDSNTRSCNNGQPYPECEENQASASGGVVSHSRWSKWPK